MFLAPSLCLQAKFDIAGKGCREKLAGCLPAAKQRQTGALSPPAPSVGSIAIPRNNYPRMHLSVKASS